MTTTPLVLGGTTYSWLHQQNLSYALTKLAEAGFRFTELTTAAPHLQSPMFGFYDRQALKKELDSLGLRVTSLNPGFLDINLISPSDDFREASIRHMIAEIELAHDLDAPYVIAIPGRRHLLSPVSDESAAAAIDSALERMLTRAEPLGITVLLETSPYGFLGGGPSLVEVVERNASSHLGIAYDCANTLNNEDVRDGVHAVAKHLRLAHVSDTKHDHWLHTSPGRGDVDFQKYADALREVGYAGPTIYELVDLEDPDPRLADDIAYFGQFGWGLEGKTNLDK